MKESNYITARDRLEDYKDSLRAGFLRYTRQTFGLLPETASPEILDIGCGSGVPTVELAKLSHGTITAIDVDRYQLNRLSARLVKFGFSANIKIVERSMFEIEFPEKSFDIIWAEGSIAVIGFKRGLKEWRSLLKPGGFLVLHDDLGNIDEKLRLIPRCGYTLVNHFILNEDVWYAQYYRPLKNKLVEIRRDHPEDHLIEEILGKDQREIDGFDKRPADYRSVFLVMKRT